MINNYVFLYLFSVLIASFSQILLKISAGKDYDNSIKEYLNIYVISAYALFFGSTILTVLALRGVSLGNAQVLESTGYIFVIILSGIFLKEKITLRKIIGNMLIIVGIIIFSYNFT